MTQINVDSLKAEVWPLVYAELPRRDVTRPTYFAYDEKRKPNTSPPAPDPLTELSMQASMELGRQVMLFIGTTDDLSKKSAQANEAAGLGFGMVHTPTHPDEIVPVMAYPVGVEQVA